MIKKLAVGAMVAVGMTVAAASQASACFWYDQGSSGGAGPCYTMQYQYCSVNPDGTGGLYVAHVRFLKIAVDC